MADWVKGGIASLATMGWAKVRPAASKTMTASLACRRRTYMIARAHACGIVSKILSASMPLGGIDARDTVAIVIEYLPCCQ